MEKRKAPCERSRFKKDRGGHSPRRLSFKTIYRHRSSTQTGRERCTRETHHPGLQRREHDSQLYKPYVRQQRLPTYIGNQRRSNLRTHMLSMIVMDLQPLNLVEEEGFQHFVQVLQPSADSPLSASWVRAELFNMYEHIRLKVQKEVSYAKDLVLSAEMWMSSKDASYLTKSEALRTVQLTQSPGADWLPVLTMLENISDQWQSISTEFMKRQEENLWLNEKERMMLDSAVVALKVIKNIVEEMGESGYSSVSNIIPMCDKLQSSLERLRQNGNKLWTQDSKAVYSSTLKKSKLASKKKCASTEVEQVIVHAKKNMVAR
ncbi:hypothetical protein MHYP_G00166630 [Metynnis hypsauchen]